MADEEEKKRLLESPRPDESGKIRGFFGECRWLSNFHISPFMFDGVLVESVEHAYQSMKAFLSDDYNLGKNIAHAKTPNDARLMGKSCPLPEGWDNMKRAIMRRAVFAKFSSDVSLLMKLVNTGTSWLEETNWWRDQYWGVYRGSGRNELGKILMEVREVLKP